MDSFNFHFERVSNVDLHPLSCPVNRLSPAKSTSSIDQFTHHHGKGDSAYSSFSGGSSAPDYSSPFIQEEINPHSMQYSDLKYVKAVYNPNDLNAGPKGMERLYRSMEAISQQCDQRNSFIGGRCCNQESPPPPPPPPPTRLDSFITIRNMENSRAYANPEGQVAETPQRWTHAASLDAAYPRPDPIYRRRVSQPNLRDPMSRSEVGQVPEPQRPASAVSRTPTGFIPLEGLKQQAGGSTGQTEMQKQRRHSVQEMQTWSTQHGTQTIINGNIQHKGQFYFVTGMCKPPEPNFKDTLSGVEEGEEEQCSEEQQCKPVVERSHSKVEQLLRNHHRRQDSWGSQGEQMAFSQNQDIRARTQYKELNDGIDPPGSLPVADKGSHSFNALDGQSQNAQGRELGLTSRRHHSSSNHIFYCGPEDHLPQSNPSTKEAGLPPQSLDPVISSKKADQENRGMRQLFDDVAKEKISKETTPLLYHLTGESRGVLANRPKTDNNPNGNWKESRRNSGALQWQSKEGPTHREEGASNSASRTTPTQESQHRMELPTDSYNTLDESFKKYYKEKLKDAQSKVLGETSFKRRDLQLSLPKRIRPNPEKRPTVLPSTFSSQGSSLASESSVPSVPGKDTIKESDKEDWQESILEGSKEKREESGNESGKECGTESSKEGSKECGKDSGKECSKENEKENGKENRRSPNLAQPQVARIGGRKRLTVEQKKMYYSEPEKLHLLGEGPSHTAHRSLGSERESLFSRDDLSEQGLVSSRRKVFETRGRALSASSLSKATLKEIQQKALVAYMERKKGHRSAEPQQPALLTPGQRHSTAGKPSDWGPRPVSGSVGPKKKLLRPLSAGRILDSSSSSVRYSQFVSPQHGAHICQSSLKESAGSAPEKAASAENLLDQPEPPEFFRARSTSTPHAFQTMSNIKDVSPEGALQRASSPKKAEGEVAAAKTRAASVSEVQRVRVVAPRGKSMEELGVPQVSRPPVLSKSSDQLDQLRTRQRSLFPKQDSSPRLSGSDDRALSRTPTPATPPVSGSSPRGRAQSTSSSVAPLSPERVGNSVFYIDSPQTLPPPPHTWESPERESPAPPSPPKGLNESRASSRIKTAPPVHSLLTELSGEDQDGLPDSTQEVSLSPGVTTDPSLWLLETSPAPPWPSPSPADDAGVKDSPNPPPLPPEADSQATVAFVDPAVENSPSTEGDPPGKQQQDEEGVEPEEGPQTGDPDLPTSAADEAKPRWEELVEEVVAKDQSLARVLCPVTNRKTAVMLMEQLLSEDTLLMEEHYRRKQEKKNSSAQQAGDRSETKEEEEEKIISPACDETHQKQETHQTPGSDVTEKKRLLMWHIEQRLQAVEAQREALQEEVRENELQSGAVDALVRESCLPAEHERYALFIGDLERVVSLLLCLSTRLARVQNALSTVDENTDAEEKKSLDSRHSLLCKQRDDAKDLKDNLDRRERVVSAILSKHLTPEQLQDYRHFVQTKASILIRLKDLEERQRLGQEQLESLTNSIPP
ncbi:protein Shroom3 [Conger conger]|uniref:protein Shroom3 n=1 Tax=Conger conger TaxID=82655 RepID=UPI002A5A901C|nr:protein Shroom3 [Conger conger]XP_061103472.1 protein Shroom3 [Conger conger]